MFPVLEGLGGDDESDHIAPENHECGKGEEQEAEEDQGYIPRRVCDERRVTVKHVCCRFSSVAAAGVKRRRMGREKEVAYCPARLMEKVALALSHASENEHMQRSTGRGHDYITKCWLTKSPTALATFSDCRRCGM